MTSAFELLLQYFDSYNDRLVQHKQPTPGYFRQFRNPVQNMSPGSGTSGHFIVWYSLKRRHFFKNNLTIVQGWFHRHFFVPGATYVHLVSRSLFTISSIVFLLCDNRLDLSICINCLVSHILWNVFYYVQHKKETHTGFRVSKWWQNFFFFFLGELSL